MSLLSPVNPYTEISKSMLSSVPPPVDSNGSSLNSSQITQVALNSLLSSLQNEISVIDEDMAFEQLAKDFADSLFEELAKDFGDSLKQPILKGEKPQESAPSSFELKSAAQNAVSSPSLKEGSAQPSSTKEGKLLRIIVGLTALKVGIVGGLCFHFGTQVVAQQTALFLQLSAQATASFLSPGMQALSFFIKTVIVDLVWPIIMPIVSTVVVSTLAFLLATYLAYLALHTMKEAMKNAIRKCVPDCIANAVIDSAFVSGKQAQTA